MKKHDSPLSTTEIVTRLGPNQEDIMEGLQPCRLAWAVEDTDDVWLNGQTQPQNSFSLTALHLQVFVNL